MPQFAWKGIGLDGRDCAGVHEARSHKQLDALLVSQQIALLDAQVIAPYSRLRPITMSARITFFEQLATLLEAGVFVDDALAILTEQTSNVAFKHVIGDIARSVQEGCQLHEALHVYHDLFDVVIIHVVHAGQEAGNLPSALRSLVKYLTFHQQFKATIGRVIMLPLITCLFFAIVAAIIIGFIVPSFAQLYHSAGKELPATTQTLLWLSAWFSWAGIALLVPVCGALYLCKRMLKRSERIMSLYEQVLLRLPVIGHLLWYGNMLAYMQALTILTKGGVSIAQGLSLSLGALSQHTMRTLFNEVTIDVNRGKALSRSFKERADRYCDASIIALIRVGEESGTLERSFEQIVAVYQQRLEKMSMLVTTLIQPLLMIVLGLLITGLIFAVYVPIFNLSEVVS